MAQTHNALDASLLGPAIRAALGIRDGTETIERFSETLQPIINLWERPDFAFLRGERLCVGYADQSAGGAGNISEMSLTNPKGSGLIVTIDHIMWHQFANTACRAKIAVATDLGTTQNTTAFRDLRIAVASATVKPVCTITTKNADANTHGFACAVWYAGSTTWPDSWAGDPWILPPNTSLILDANGATNTVLGATVMWRERKALRGELIT